MAFDFVHGGNLVSAMLTDTGASGGLVNAIGNYSATPKSFYIQPLEKVVYKIHTINLELVTVINTFEAGGYGSGAVLPNGLIMFIENKGVITNLLPVGGTIIKNGEWARLSSPQRSDTVVPSGNNPVHFYSRLVLPEMFEFPIYLNGSTEDKFGFILTDDFSTRVSAQNWLTTGIIRTDIEKGAIV